MAYSDYTYSDFTVEGAIRIVKACLAAQQPDMIVRALIERRSPESVEAELAAANLTPQPAAPAPAAKPTSIFGEPTPQQRDALAVAIQRRLEQVYPKRAS